MKDCTTCPSFIPAESDASRVRFGKGANTPMCGRHGHILSLPFMTDDEAKNAALSFGSKCPDHGKEIPEKPVQITPRVLKPDMTGLPDTPSELSTCSACEHFVDASTVNNKFDVPLPVCAKKGIAIFKTNRECKGCAFASEKPSLHDSSTMSSREVIDELSGRFEISVKDLLGSSGVSDTKPTEYVTDKTVKANEDAAGIQAWRRVEIEGRGKVVYLPIFKTEHFSEEQQKLIPKHGGPGNPELYVDHAGVLQAFAVICYDLDFPLVLEGEPGTGKTEANRWLAYLMNVPFIRFQINAETSTDDLFGKPHIESGTDYYEYGRLPKAWEQTCILGIDEWNVGDPVIGQAFRGLFDDSKELVLDANRGETVERNGYCFPVLTQNPSHDMRNIGANQQAAADVSRTMTLKVEMPPEPLVKHIIKERVATLDGEVISDELVDKIYLIGQDIRSMALDGTYPFSWGVREYIKVARLAGYYDLERAFRFAGLNAVDSEVEALVVRAIRDRE